MYCRTHFVSRILLGAMLGSFCCAAERPSAGTRYTIKSTTTVTITLPVSSARGENLYRNAAGQWVGLPNAKLDARGTLTFTLSPAQLPAGSTVVLIGKPDWLDPNDSTPPRITKVRIDGKELAPREKLDLGWIDRAPLSLELHVADAQNPLDPSSAFATVGVRRVRAGTKGLRFDMDPADPKRARFACSVPALVGTVGDGSTRITLQCDDFAPDDRQCAVTLAFTITRPPEIKLGNPARTAPNGIKIFVDSIYKGYDDVECMLDGKPQPLGRSTRGVTWASAETDAPHWMCFVFPKARRLSGVNITWTNYKEQPWTSERYDIMTWDGRRWVRALRVQNKSQPQTSTHTFKARTTDRVLVWVPPGGNHPERPNLLWVAEVAFVP